MCFQGPLTLVGPLFNLKKETWVRSLGQEDPLEKEMANSLQYSCLENSMDGGGWWATVDGVAKVWTQLSDFTSLHFTVKTIFSVFLLFVNYRYIIVFSD